MLIISKKIWTYFSVHKCKKGDNVGFLVSVPVQVPGTTGSDNSVRKTKPTLFQDGLHVLSERAVPAVVSELLPTLQYGVLGGAHQRASHALRARTQPPLSRLQLQVVAKSRVVSPRLGCVSPHRVRPVRPDGPRQQRIPTRQAETQSVSLRLDQPLRPR